MSAQVVNIQSRIKIGNSKALYVGEIVPPSSYVTGGTAVDTTANTPIAGPAKFDHMQISSVGGYVPSFVKSSQKVLLYRQKDPGNAGGADIALPEVGSTVDVSGTTFPFMALGPQ